MSLIGSLDDLGLGDILQIINLSQKSGVLIVIGDQGEGRIVFRDGLVRGAAQKSGPHSLRDLLVGGGHVSAEAYESVATSGEDVDIQAELVERQLIGADELVAFCRETVESAVIAMFSWLTGEFSFDVRIEGEPGDPELLLATGVNAQYLAMEGARLQDEGGQAAAGDLDFGTGDGESFDEPPPSATAEFADRVVERAIAAAETDSEPAAEALSDAGFQSAAPEYAPELAPEFECAAADAPTPGAPFLAAPMIDAEPVVEASSDSQAVPVASDALGHVDGEPSMGAPARQAEADEAAEAVPREPPLATLPPVVVIDPELRVLEWTKRVLKPEFSRVHIFQQSALGLQRIRQYLSRAEIPIVLISTETPGEPAAGIDDMDDFVRRLKGQAPRMTILWLCGALPPPDCAPADGSVVRPRLELLRDARAAHERDELAAAMRRVLLAGFDASEPVAQVDDEPLPVATPSDEQHLREVTQALGDASAQREILPRVIEFASESFSRVAMFLVREGRAEGVAEIGLGRAEGPEGDAFRELSLEVRESAWFERVLQTRAAVRLAGGDADAGFCQRLCGPSAARPLEAFVAPIESAGQIVALLYADQLPAQSEVGDTSALEVVLRHAGQALDRAFERALREEDNAPQP